ncbi:hypothetical protein [Pseudoduganella sp. HUAS MS19]
MRAYLLLFLLVLIPFSARAAGQGCPARDGWSASCFTERAGVRQLKPQYLRKLSFKKSGKAVIVIDGWPNEVVALDRRGRVVVPGIYHTSDYDYPYAPRGVARFADQSGKCGYFQSNTFEILVPAVYDHCIAYHDGDEANACIDCEMYCTHPDCYSLLLVGGTGFDLDAEGRVTQQYPLPDLDKACTHGIKKLVREGRSRHLECKKDPNPPFKL